MVKKGAPDWCRFLMTRAEYEDKQHICETRSGTGNICEIIPSQGESIVIVAVGGWIETNVGKMTLYTLKNAMPTVLIGPLQCGPNGIFFFPFPCWNVDHDPADGLTARVWWACEGDGDYMGFILYYIEP